MSFRPEPFRVEWRNLRFSHLSYYVKRDCHDKMDLSVRRRRVYSYRTYVKCFLRTLWRIDMGLEMVDIVIQTEDAFNITISDTDVYYLDTVGKYYEYVMDKVRQSTPSQCLTSVAFYRLRKAFIEVFGISRND